MTHTAKSLIINCSLNDTRSKDLLVAVKKFNECKVINFSDVDEGGHIAKEFDAVVIGGSAARVVQTSDRAKFENVEMIIKNCNIPLLGICFGHQLLCWTFGAEVGSLPKQVANRFEHVRVIQSSEIFAGFKEGQMILLSENHYDYVIKDSLGRAGFTLLADSVSCEVEAVKHKTKPFYGVQFHPECITINGQTYPEGYRIIENFYRNAVKR